jgi:hypothetical protein
MIFGETSARVLDRLFADDCIIYRKITNKNDIEKLQKDLDSVGGIGDRKWDENTSG